MRNGAGENGEDMGVGGGEGVIPWDYACKGCVSFVAPATEGTSEGLAAYHLCGWTNLIGKN